MAVSPRYCAEQKVQTGSAAVGGHRRVATRETTGDLATRRGAGDPETRAEWMKVLRYGHLRSAPVVVDVGYARSGNRLHSLQPCRSPRASLGASSMASCLSVDAQTRRCDPTRSLFRKFTWSAERSISPAHLCPHGLWASLRHPAQRRVVQSAEGLEGSSDPVHLSGMYRKMTRRSRRSREFAGFYRFPPIFALAGCGRRCAVLSASLPRRICSPHTGTRRKGNFRKWQIAIAARTCYALRDTPHSHMLRVCFA